MKVIVHADDFGLSRGINHSILEAHDQGVLHRTSIIANGYDFDYAVNEKLKRPTLDLSVHLNFVEGAPLSQIPEVTLLKGKSGGMEQSFGGLWASYLFGSKAHQKNLERAIESEICAQVTRVRKALKTNDSLHVDSHRHLHMIPFVFKSLVKVSRELGIGSIRLPFEKFVVPSLGFSPVDWGVSFAKHSLLNALSKNLRPLLLENEIESNSYLIGVLYTGKMNEAVVQKSLGVLSKESPQSVEILFHPGQCLPEEKNIWKNRRELFNYYNSRERNDEKKVLLQPGFKRLVEAGLP